MKDEQNTRDELLEELATLQQEVIRLKRAEAERRLAQTDLRESKERFRELVDLLPDVVFEIDASGEFTFANRRAFDITGYIRDDLERGINALQMFIPEDRDRAKENIGRVLRGEDVGITEYTARRKDDTTFPVLIHSSPILKEGQPIGLRGFVIDVTQRKRVEQKLRESEERFRKLSEASLEGVILHRDGVVVDVNSALAGIVGREAEELIGGQMAAFVDSTVLPEYRDVVRKNIAAGVEGRYEIAISRKDGAIVPLELEARQVELTNGVVRVACVREITERKKAEKTLRESEERFRSLIENISDVITVVDAEGIVRYESRSLQSALGYAPEERVGDSIFPLLHPEDLPTIRGALQSALANPGMALPFKVRARHKGGSWRTIEGIGTNLLDDPAVKGIVVNYRDVTQRERAERMLHALNRAALVMEEARTHKGMFEAMAGQLEAIGLSSVLFLMDGDGRKLFPTYLSYDPRAIRAAEKLVGIGTEDFAIEVDGMEELSQLIERGEAFFCEDVADFTRALLPRPVRGITRPLARILNVRKAIWAPLTSAEKVIGALTVQAADLTSEHVAAITAFARQMSAAWRKASLMQDLENGLKELKQTQAQLVQAQKMEAIGRLAGGIAHDFNNLLTVINGYSQFLIEALAPDDPLRKDVEEIHRAGERATALTRQLLAFSRRQMLEMRVLNLNDILAGMGNMLRRIIREDIRLEMRLADNLGNVCADPGQIEQVVANLAVNARDAMPNGGVLLLETTNAELDERYTAEHMEIAPGPYASLAVSDTGCGMTPEVMEHLFEPFFTTKEPGRGTGLGLATVYGIVKQCGGDVIVYSEPRKGTTFKIYLPRVDEAKEKPLRQPEEKALPGGTETILLVEDQKEVRRFTARLLQNLGYTVLDAANGQEALSLLEKNPMAIDLVLTDVVMPQMNGQDLADRVFRLRRDIKVLYASGYTDLAIVQSDMLDSGMSFMEKPFTAAQLAEKLREVLDTT